jgi:hypothetical protein
MGKLRSKIVLGLILLAALPAPGSAQVERIELDVAGYLCGL